MKTRWPQLISLVFLAAVLVLLPAGCKKKAEETAAPAASTAAPQETPMMTGQANSMENPYTKENPGPWAGKEGAHVPQITYEKAGSGLKVTVRIDNHPMDPQAPHYIMSIMLKDGLGTTLGEKTFVATDPEPVATFELMSIPEKLVAYEHCNLHGIWMSETAVMAQ
jgi:superoxide reductase